MKGQSRKSKQQTSEATADITFSAALPGGAEALRLAAEWLAITLPCWTAILLPCQPFSKAARVSKGAKRTKGTSGHDVFVRLIEACCDLQSALVSSLLAALLGT